MSRQQKGRRQLKATGGLLAAFLCDTGLAALSAGSQFNFMFNFGLFFFVFFPSDFSNSFY